MKVGLTRKKRRRRRNRSKSEEGEKKRSKREKSRARNIMQMKGEKWRRRKTKCPRRVGRSR
jgi:hypothetical protein